MLPTLHGDLITYISNYLKLQDIVNLKQINKECNNIFDNLYFSQYASFLYSKQFWEKASNRNPILSNPLKNLQQELLRIEKFNNSLIKSQQLPWTEQQFFEYWESIEIYFNQKNKLHN